MIMVHDGDVALIGRFLEKVIELTGHDIYITCGARVHADDLIKQLELAKRGYPNEQG